MFDKLRICTSTQLFEPFVHCAPNDHECSVPAITIRLPKLCIQAVDADEEPLEEWEAEGDVKGGPLDPHEVKNARDKEIRCLWDMEVYEYSTEAEARARTGRNPVVLKWLGTNKR